MGCGTSVALPKIMILGNFQYPLRAYGVWNAIAEGPQSLRDTFQYPLRAYGVWNMLEAQEMSLRGATFSTLCGPMGCGTSNLLYYSAHSLLLSVPSAGLWGVEPSPRRPQAGFHASFSTLCGPMGCGTIS